MVEQSGPFIFNFQVPEATLYVLLVRKPIPYNLIILLLYVKVIWLVHEHCACTVNAEIFVGD